MAHVAGQADAAPQAAKADRDLEQLRLLHYHLAGLSAAVAPSAAGKETRQSVSLKTADCNSAS